MAGKALKPVYTAVWDISQHTEVSGIESYEIEVSLIYIKLNGFYI